MAWTATIAHDDKPMDIIYIYTIHNYTPMQAFTKKINQKTPLMDPMAPMDLPVENATAYEEAPHRPNGAPH